MDNQKTFLRPPPSQILDSCSQVNARSRTSSLTIVRFAAISAAVGQQPVPFALRLSDRHYMMGSGALLKYAGRSLFGVTSPSELPVTASCVVRLQNKHISPGKRSELSPHPCQRILLWRGEYASAARRRTDLLELFRIALHLCTFKRVGFNTALFF